MDPRFSQIPTLIVDTAIPNPTSVGAQLVLRGSIEGVPPTDSADVFALNCLLQRRDATGSYLNEGTVALPVWSAIEAGTLADGSVTKAKLATGVKATFMDMFLDDSYTTTGGAAAEVITVTGAVATDKVIVSLYDAGTNTVSIASAVAGTDQITVTFSADPGNDAVIAYVVKRATA